jgi:threonine dehydrogenase-like Zn-dependent dehydrogenase
VRALQVRRDAVRFGLARLSSVVSSTRSVRVGPLEYRNIQDPPRPAGEGWSRVHTSLSGICGSDLALIDGHASTYFEDWVSFPFVPGHEVVGRLDDGTRVVLEPVLGHAARGANPPFEGAAPGDGDDYAHLVTGPLSSGIQTGFCCSTGGGWAPWFWAHESQLHHLPDTMPDERAVLVEPLAGSVHAAYLTRTPVVEAVDEPVIAVIGAGTIGLGAVAALRGLHPRARILVAARYPHQHRLARSLGADEVVEPAHIDRAVRRATGSHRIGASLSSGAHATVDAVGDSGSLTTAIGLTRPRGRAVVLGMPSTVSLDLTPLWHREVELKGSYTYGTEWTADGRMVRTFDLALDLADRIAAENLLSATYRLDQHVEALTHAATAGRRGAVKIAFDLRGST